MIDLPISETQLKKLNQIVKESLKETNKVFNKQVDEVCKMLKEELTWGQFKILLAAINKFIEGKQ